MIRSWLALVLLFVSASAHATPILSYVDLEAIAKTVVTEEVTALNAIVASFMDPTAPAVSDWRGYKNADLQIFKKFNKPKGVSADVIYDVCILTRETITAITDTQITKSNLKVTSNINAVNSLRNSMNGKFFRIAERACLNSRERFIARMKTARNSDRPLNFDDNSLKNMARIVFFPTDYAKPTLLKEFLKALPILIQATMFVKGLSAFTGWAVSGVWMSVIAISGPALSLKNLAPRADELFKQKDISTLEIEHCTRIDLTPAEGEFAKE